MKYLSNLPDKIKLLVNKINISNNATIDYLIILIRCKIKKEEKLRFIYIIILNTDISNNDNIGIIILKFWL